MAVKCPIKHSINFSNSGRVFYTQLKLKRNLKIPTDNIRHLRIMTTSPFEKRVKVCEPFYCSTILCLSFILPIKHCQNGLLFIDSFPSCPSFEKISPASDENTQPMRRQFVGRENVGQTQCFRES